jgi:competence transcription factor ComK
MKPFMTVSTSDGTVVLYAKHITSILEYGVDECRVTLAGKTSYIVHMSLSDLRDKISSMSL